jgi:HEAT repeat protein
MSTPAGLLSDLSTVLLLLRDRPDAKEELKLAFQRVVSALGNRDHVLRVAESGIAWDRIEVPVGRGELAALHEHLKAHGIGEIRLPAGLMTSALLSLLRIIAAPAGTYGSFDHLVARLDATGVGMVPVLPLESQAGAGPAPREAAARPGASLPDAARPRPERPPPPAEEDDGRLQALGPDALTEAKVGLMHFATLQTQAVSPMDQLVHRLEQEADEATALDLLNQLVTAGEMAARRSDWVELLKAVHALVRLEAQGGPAAERRGYGIALRRMLPRSVLERFARLVTQGSHKAEAVAVLRRMGADGTEVLLKYLAESDDLGERRAYYSALKEMTEGTTLLVHMLSHDQWFVVRNAADLCGDLGLEQAVPALGKLIQHHDERVRRAAASALARIGGAGAAEALRRAFKDPAPAVRLQAAQDLDGRRAKGLAMSLAVAAVEESRPDVQREMFLALGRIGSVEAIQALLKAAEPSRGLFKRKPREIRLAAVAGLHAAGPSAANALKTLLEDEDREVRGAVQQALQTLWE